MRKSFVILIALLLMALSVVCYAQTTISAQKDQVQFQETVHYGDKSVVEGVTVGMKSNYLGRLFWDSTYQIGKEPIVNTDYRFFSKWQETYFSEREYPYVHFFMEEGIIHGDERIYEEIKADDKGLLRAYKELYQSMKPDTDKMSESEIMEYDQTDSMQIYLKDYMDYHEFDADFVLGEDFYLQLQHHMLLSNLESATKDKDSELIKKAEQELGWYEEIHDFFKFPVLEDEVSVLNLRMKGKTISGVGYSTMNMGESTGEIDPPDAATTGDSFYPWIDSTTANDNIYMTFDAHTYQGKIIDTSLIPGGYGIYRMPYNEKKQEIYPKELQMVYALDPKVSIVKIQADANGKNLMLFTLEEGKTYLSVIDIETMSLVQKSLFAEKDIEYMDSWMTDGYMVVYGTDIYVWDMNESGLYENKFSIDCDKLRTQMGEYYYQTIENTAGMAFDWDGEKLLIANYIVTDFSDPRCNFYVTAFDANGLQFFGTYKSSLDTGGSGNLNDLVEPLYGNAVSIRW